MGVGGWWIGVWGGGGALHAHDIGNSQGFPQWGLQFAIEIIMFNMFMYAHACMYVHACAHELGHQPPTPHPSTQPPLPEPQGTQNTKIQ